MRIRLLTFSCATVLVLGGAGWCAAPGPAMPVGVVIVTLDTTRANRLSAYGFLGGETPHLDRLAAAGIVFNQAVSVAPLTLPAHASLFTGLLPLAHGVRDNADPPLADAHTTLAERLRAAGFRTAAFVGSVVLDHTRGLAQGFDHYSDAVPADGTPALQRRGDEVIDEALHWLAGLGRDRFLLWAHLYDPHKPYDPPAPFTSMADPYLGEIAFADAQVGRLIDALDRRQLLDRTIVIVVGDHGESLGDHGEDDHGIFIYESVVRVPFILRAPHVSTGRVQEVVRITDIMPTVLDLLGLPVPAADGVSLALLLRGLGQDLGLEAYSESLYPQRFGWSPLYALRQGRYKFIEAPRPELYDLDRDPYEERNVYDLHPAQVRAMRRALMAIHARYPPGGAGVSEAAAVSPELRQRLAALGYLGHPARSQGTNDATRPDPKDCIAVYNARQDAGTLPPTAPVSCGDVR